MNYGFLNNYFEGIGVKRLSEVEIPDGISRQHEFNGISEFKKIFGKERLQIGAKFIYLSDDDDKVTTGLGALTWYDSREDDPTRSSEFRLYYTGNDAISEARADDLVVVCKVSSTEALVIVVPSKSTSETQILWLFGLSEVGKKFIVKDLSDQKIEIGFAGQYVLSTLGIDSVGIADDNTNELLEKFGLEFPKTKEFSEFARQKTKGVSPIEDPDGSLVSWLEMEEALFRTLEREIVRKQLEKGFGKNGTDVDAFVDFSLSVQNRRKSRAGHAFENHLAVLFNLNKITYSKGAPTERNNKPDFIFPGIRQYTDLKYPADQLTMLGVKTTAKDRWRQVLSEADRIPNKHLITLQPAISVNQTDEMIAQKLQLVVPGALHTTFSKKQQSQLLSVANFVSLVKERQK